MHKSRHQILTIKSVHYSAMARNGVRKILDFESSFESAGKEASKWANQRCKRGKSDAVYLERIQAHSFLS